MGHQSGLPELSRFEGYSIKRVECIEGQLHNTMSIITTSQFAMERSIISSSTKSSLSERNARSCGPSRSPRLRRGYACSSCFRDDFLDMRIARYGSEAAAPLDSRLKAQALNPSGANSSENRLSFIRGIL